MHVDGQIYILQNFLNRYQSMTRFYQISFAYISRFAANSIRTENELGILVAILNFLLKYAFYGDPLHIIYILTTKLYFMYNRTVKRSVHNYFYVIL